MRKSLIFDSSFGTNERLLSLKENERWKKSLIAHSE
jgi:hypothetical protein